MKLFSRKEWTNWADIAVRVDCYGKLWLLQIRQATDGTKQFKNTRIDNTLFHVSENGNNAGKILTDYVHTQRGA